MLLLGYTGLRVFDVAVFSRDRIRDGHILLHTQKTGGAVYLPLAPELEAALNAVPPPRGAAEGCLSYFWNGLTSARRAAVFRKSAVAGVHAHRFRHMLAIEVLTDGGTEQDVADILGISAQECASTTPNGHRPGRTGLPAWRS